MLLLNMRKRNGVFKMTQPKVNLTRSQLLKLLQDNGFDKSAVADILGVGEASIRRACKRLTIDCDVEKRAKIADVKIPKFRSKTSSSSASCKVGTFVVVPDTHAQTVLWNYLALVCQFIRDFKPEYIIHIGDLMDYECLMGKMKTKYPSFDGADMKSLATEYEACAKQISMINQAAPKNCKKIFLKGNHEHRADMLIKKNPEFKEILEMEQHLELQGWQIMPYLQKVKLGKLNFIHGEFYGTHPVKKHLEVYQKNVVFGHTHAIEQSTKPSPMREIPIWGAMAGCLCSVNADYMRNKSSRAEHGFAYGWFEKDSGDFDVMIKRIIRGKFWAEGRRYSV